MKQEPQQLSDSDLVGLFETQIGILKDITQPWWEQVAKDEYARAVALKREILVRLRDRQKISVDNI